MKVKIIILSIACFLLLFQNRVLAPRNYAIGESFNMEIANALKFRSTEEFILTVQTGVLNGTNCTLLLTGGKGQLVFYSVDNCTIHASSPSDNNLHYTVSGATRNKLDTNLYESIITSGFLVRLSWTFTTPTIVDTYFLAGLGTFGICMMIYGTVSTAKTWIEKGLSLDFIKSCGWLMLWLLLGFMFLVAWIWPV